uniref:DDE Tnp4 domain-containing protein n=1 Tax=Chenopodium quinoa TaxID=63459 RepID=A0A803N7P5_CHEQI
MCVERAFGILKARGVDPNDPITREVDLEMDSQEVVKPPTTSIQPEIHNNPRFFPWFEDFIGAIDGTHVRASVPIEIQDRFRGRKGGTTQNLLTIVDFDTKFTYVLAGWEGSAHDSRVVNDALRKYYPTDVGFGNRKGVMPPYRKTRYQLKEYTNNPPENERSYSTFDTLQLECV